MRHILNLVFFVLYITKLHSSNEDDYTKIVPKDIMRVIFLKCDLSDLPAIKTTCKRWHHFTFGLRLPISLISAEDVHQYVLSKRRFNHVALRLGPGTELTDDLIYQLSENNNTIKVVSTNTSENRSSNYFLTAISLAKEIKIIDAPLNDWVYNMPKQVEKLTIHLANGENLPAILPMQTHHVPTALYLRHLHIKTHNYNLSKDMLEYISNILNLECLTLKCGMEIGAWFSVNLNSKKAQKPFFPKLKQLVIDFSDVGNKTLDSSFYCPPIGDRTIYIDTFNHMKSLERLELKRVHIMGNLANLLKLKYLRHVVLHYYAMNCSIDTYDPSELEGRNFKLSIVKTPREK